MAFQANAVSNIVYQTTANTWIFTHIVGAIGMALLRIYHEVEVSFTEEQDIM
jgi:hypothetical protein